MKTFLLILSGVLGGVLGGMGMGGGTLLIPMLTIFCDVEQHNAQAINLVAFLPMAVVALILHAKNKLIDLKGVLFIAIPAVLVSVFASILAKDIESKLLGRLFGGFLILLGIYQLISGIKQFKSAKKSNQAD